MLTVSIKDVGSWGDFRKEIDKPMINSVTRLSKIAEIAAKEYYMQKRKTDKTPSMIFASIVTEQPKFIFTGEINVTGIVFAGGPTAPYAIFVDEGHRMRDGSPWEGYHFMESGLEVADKAAEMIIEEEFNK